MNEVLAEDLEYILNALTDEQRAFFSNGRVLITGCAGFLGYSLLHFFCRFAEVLGIERIVGLDSFILGRPPWLERLSKECALLEVESFDVASSEFESLSAARDANIVIHMASIASPAFYRKYPIETLEANIWGLRSILNFYSNRSPAGLLFFSSSEVYGDPSPEHVPTDESYRGNVATMGPRSCYDEAKRCGETMCYLYAERFDLPVAVVRPFNNYGPGMRLDDKRVPADFAAAIFENRDIEIFSDGSPTRTFCYVADAVAGYLKALSNGRFDYFNIGIAEPEISVRELAEIYRRAGVGLCGYTGEIRLSPPPEAAYLTHNPNRRCPVIEKARTALGYEPKILVEEGVERFMKFIIAEGGSL